MPESAQEQSWCEFACSALAMRMEKMFEQTAAVLEETDHDALRRMRVWSRRSRAAFALAAPCLPERQARQAERELKRAADALGAARDLDVAIEELNQRKQALPLAQRSGLTLFAEHLQQERSQRQKEVILALQRMKQRGLPELMRALLQKDDSD